MESSRSTAGRPDYYALLGVSFHADDDAIRAAYRALAKQHHPDLADDETPRATERFLQIQEAYDVLRDADRRALYDLERAREEAEEALGWQADFVGAQAQGSGSPAGRAVMPVAPPFVLRRRRTASRFWLLLMLVGATVAVGFAVGQQRPRYLAAGQDQVTVVRVDEPRRPDPRQAELRALSREVDEASRRQAAQTEAVKKQAESRIATAAPPSPPAPVEAADGKVACSGEGRAFFVTRQGGINVSYNGGPLVRPVISEQAAGMVLMSKVEPTNRISIAFLKGDKDGTIVLINDAAGNVFRTFGVECSAAVF